MVLLNCFDVSVFCFWIWLIWWKRSANQNSNSFLYDQAVVILLLLNRISLMRKKKAFNLV